MAGYTATEVCRALASDQHPDSGWMREHGQIVEPRTELWLAQASMWVRARGYLVTGWKGNEYCSRWFGPWDRWRIRRAVRRWERQRLTYEPAFRAQAAAQRREATSG